MSGTITCTTGTPPAELAPVIDLPDLPAVPAGVADADADADVDVDGPAPGGELGLVGMTGGRESGVEEARVVADR
jgi:hypothetical protein